MQLLLTWLLTACISEAKNCIDISVKRRFCQPIKVNWAYASSQREDTSDVLSEEHIVEFKEAFCFFDKDGDGEFSAISSIIEPCDQLKVYHGYLASSYHTGILSGFVLISSYMESVASSKTSAKAIVIGLGAGLLPMFLHGCMPFMHIEVVELDLVVLDLAKGYFGFTEEDHLQVHIVDRIQFIRDSKSCASANVVSIPGNNNAADASNGICTTFLEEGGVNTKVDIIIIDMDSADSSSGMTCPAVDFVEDSFLQTVKKNHFENGLLVINLVAQSQDIKDQVISIAFFLK